MSDNDLIRRGDAMHIVEGWRVLEDDIEALPAASTFTAADLAAAWEMGRDEACDACEDYPRASPEYSEYIHYDDQITHSQDCIRSLAPPADLTEKVREGRG